MGPQKTGMYFDGDIKMSANALIEMFGDAAPLRARGRAVQRELPRVTS